MKILFIASSLIFNILFVDNKTKEPLTGVKVETEKAIYYSDLDGNVVIKENEKVLKVSYVSYNSIEKPFNPKDTIIKLFTKF